MPVVVGQTALCLCAILLIYLLEPPARPPMRWNSKNRPDISCAVCASRHPHPMAKDSTKKKEIYTYEAPWPIYGMNWSVRPDRKFRLAVGSFIEEYTNKVCFFHFPLPFIPSLPGKRAVSMASVFSIVQLWPWFSSQLCLVSPSHRSFPQSCAGMCPDDRLSGRNRTIE